MEIKTMIETELIKKMHPKLKECAKIISESITNKHPIIVRHHSDTDGYAAAVALERAIQPLIYAAHLRERDSFFHYRRSPLLAPVYNNDDANKDINMFTNEKIGNTKTPLLIILDTGSSDESFVGIKKAKIYGAKVIVIDHHPMSSEKNPADIFVNPHVFGSDYELSAGMIVAELGHIINPKTKELATIAAVAAIGDKVESKEAAEYIKLAEKEGNDKKKLQMISDLIDFESDSLGFLESKRMIDDIFGADSDNQKKLFEIILPIIEKKKKIAEKIGVKYTTLQQKKDITIALIPLYEITIRGDYPPSGRISGIVHDSLKKDHKKLVTLGILNESIIFRATEESGFDSNKIIDALKEKYPDAMISGGGHKRAAGIRFISKMRDEIVEEIIRQI